jgi:hypothetical protein
MIVKTYALLSLALVFAALHAEATTTFAPPSPTAQDGITAIIDVPSSAVYDTPSTSVIGNMIRTNLPVLSFVLGPPVFITHAFASFGPLPPGTYTYQVYEVYQGQSVLLSQATIVVAPAIPAMNSLYLSILAILLAAIACFTLGKHA